ncbi:MAG: ROK family transcriptional regulator [Bacillota bacterium]|nr:ROK family transcriptional regulator [Bacillota bacterium]
MMQAQSSRQSKKMTADQQQMKVANQGLILRLIHQEAPLSRADLTARTRLSPTTVSALVGGLIDCGLVQELGIDKSRTSGRKPILLDINPTGAVLAVAELQKDSINMAVYDLRGQEIDRLIEPVTDYARVGECLVQSTGRLLAANNIHERQLRGICLGVPGIIDPERGIVTASTVLPIQPDNPFLATIRNRYSGAHIILENQSSLCAYAELDHQIKAGRRNLIFMDVDVGIGAGIVLDGKLFRGSDGLAGEIGHMTVDLKGPKCACGNRGCLERIASVPALIQRVIYGMMSGRRTLINELTQGDFNQIGIPVLRQAADAGDPLVLEAIDETAQALAAGIISVFNLLNLQTVVLGGAMAQLGDCLLDRVNAVVVRSVLAAMAKPADRLVYCSRIKENAATQGGAQLLLDQLLQNFYFKSSTAAFSTGRPAV